MSYVNQIDGLAKTALAIHEKWNAGELFQTPLGTIWLHSYPLFVKSNTIEFYKASENFAFLRLRKKDGVWFFDNTSNLGNDFETIIADATSICEAIALYCASDDFEKKSEGSIARLKRITRAIKGE